MVVDFSFLMFAIFLYEQSEILSPAKKRFVSLCEILSRLSFLHGPFPCARYYLATPPPSGGMRPQPHIRRTGAASASKA